MNVLNIVSKVGMGGIEKTLLLCLPYFKREGVNISLFAFKKDGELEPQFKSHDVSLYYPVGKIKFISKYLSLYKLIKNSDIKLVHSRFGFTSGIICILCALARKPVIISIHSENPASKPTWRKNAIKRFILSCYLNINKFLIKWLARYIVGHSRTNLNYYIGKNASVSGKYKIVYNGVDFKTLESSYDLRDPQLIEFLNDAQLVILHIGSFRWQKNHRFLIECFDKCTSNKKSCKLILVGDGPLLGKMKQLVKERGIEKSVYFTGMDSQAAKYFKYANFLFFPSLTEGLGNVILEAEYSNVPVFASNAPAHYESTYSGYHKYFFNPTDICDAEEKFNFLVSDLRNNKLDDTKFKAKKFVERRFSIETMATNLIELYKIFC